MGLRSATVEDVRNALRRVTEGLAGITASQYGLRVKSLLTYAHKLGVARQVTNPSAQVSAIKELLDQQFSVYVLGVNSRAREEGDPGSEGLRGSARA